jgi:hypothetical protein
MFVCFVVRCGYKNEHPKGVCLKEIEGHVVKVLVILGLLVNIMSQGGGDYITPILWEFLQRMMIFTLIMTKILI